MKRNYTRVMEDYETQLNDETISQEKSPTGKKIFGGCGCATIDSSREGHGRDYWGYSADR